MESEGPAFVFQSLSRSVPMVPVFLPLLKSIVLSYRPVPSDSLHRINPKYALLRISRRKATARTPKGSGRGRLRGHPPTPSPSPLHRNRCKTNSSLRIPMAFPLFIYNPFPSSLFPCPSKLCSEAAQFRNEDRIKIFPETVQYPATHTKTIT